MLNVHATSSHIHFPSTSSLPTHVRAEPSTSGYGALVAATTAVSSTATVPPDCAKLSAARKILGSWLDWKARLQRHKACLQEDALFITTIYPPRTARRGSPYTLDKSQCQGMINCTPVDGSGATLSRYYRRKDKLGKGTYATVYEGPRSYVLRVPIMVRGSTASTINSADYKDLSSFIPLTWISEKRQICRNAGTDLYHYFACERRSLTLSDFETASADLMHLHQRNLYHMDIKLENMACKIVDGKPLLSFIDCDSITNDAGVANAAITYPREKLRPSDVERILRSGKADDEYAFLLLLMMVTDLSFGPLYSWLGKPGAEKEEKREEAMHSALLRYSTIFADKFIKSEHRDALVKFINAPTDANALKQPLHDMIDWSRGLDLCSAMWLCDVDAIRYLGARVMATSLSDLSKMLFLLAQNANGKPGLHWPVKENNIVAVQSWDNLVRQLPNEAQAALMDRIYRVI
jgi:hypothetical protein